MIAGTRGGWQTVVADLALILFMVTAAAMGRDRPENSGNPLPAMGEPQAIFRADAQAPPFARWLASQPPDRRQRLTVVARYAAGEGAGAAERALVLEAQARRLGYATRVILEPSSRTEVLAVLAFDAGANWHGDCTAGGGNTENLPCE